MVPEEESFPRSNNVRGNLRHPKFKPNQVPEDEQLFKSRKRLASPSTGTSNSKVKRRKKISDVGEKNLKKIVIENLTLNRLIENMVVYGCLQEINDFELKFSITGGIVVDVPITNISTPYTHLIEAFANEESNSDVKIAKLSSIFDIGDYFPVKILSKRISDSFHHKEVIGSINPKDVFSNFTLKSLQKLPHGFNLVAAVSSKEDHGYLMDLGVHNFKGFLPFEDLQNNSHDVDLNIGQLIHCSVNQTSERSLSLTVNQKSSNFTLTDDHNPSILFFTPGTKTKVTITGSNNSGLELDLPGEYKGFVPRNHISDDLSISPKEIKIGEITQGHVLYVHPHTKQICVSLKTKLKRKKIKSLLETIRIGLIIEDAIVCARSQFGNMIFRLPSNNYAIALKKNLFEPKEFDEDKVNIVYPIGSHHTARVKKFHLVDNLIEISLRKSFIEREEITLDDISIGTIVEGTVKKYRTDGIYVKLGFGVNGFIPNIHLIDAPLINLEKTRTQLFPIRKKVTCRVLKYDSTSMIPRITLTAKKTLLKMDENEIFQDISAIKSGSQSTGVVCLTTDKGILLEFFNRLCGFIPLRYLATYKIEHPDKVFQLGQLIKCSVVSVDVSSKRIVCSLLSIEESKKLKVNLQIKHKNDFHNFKLEVGQILKKMKIISKIPMKGFDLTNPQEKIQVFLPITHLSDDPKMCLYLFLAYKVNDTFDQVMVFSKDSANVVSVTRKAVFLKQNHHMVTKEDDIAINVPFPAIVRHVTSTGVFFETPNSQYGVIRKKFLQDGFYDQPQKLGLIRGQTIFVNAFDVSSTFEQTDYDSNYLKSFKFSMKLSSVWNEEIDENTRIDILKNYFYEQDLVKQQFKQQSQDIDLARLASYSIGQVVTYVVTEITDQFIRMNVNLTGSKSEPTVVGFAYKQSNFSNLTISQMGNAIVCDMDFEKKHLIIFLQPKPDKLVRQVKNFSKTSLDKLRVSQTIKGTVIYSNEKYVLVVLSGHVPGLVAFVSIKKHYNDLRHIAELYSAGESYHFLIEHIDNQLVLTTLSAGTEKTTEKIKNDKFKIRKLISRKESPVQKSNEKDVKPEKNVSKQIPQSVDKFDWDVVDLSKLNNRVKLEELRKKMADNSDDSDSDEEETKNNQKRKSRDERNEEVRLRESHLREKENRLADTNRTPQDEQDFEMAVVASPNSSLVWIKYMAFFLERQQYDKARAVGERALQKISFREDKERLNIWISLLNLENNYGDQDSMKEMIEKAIKFNDARTIYSRLAIIYDESDKKDQAEQMYKTMIRKFHSDESVWIDFMLFYMKNGRIDEARKLFKQALNGVDKRHHVDLISKFAQLEFRYGDREQGKTIFENLLSTYWKRLDKWSIYIDMLIKHTLTDNMGNDNDNNVQDKKDALEFIRSIFERLLTFKFSPHKMKFIFKKYYDFESKYCPSNENMEENLERIRQKALEYVENGIN